MTCDDLSPWGSSLLSLSSHATPLFLFFFCAMGRFSFVPVSFCLKQEYPCACLVCNFFTKENSFLFNPLSSDFLFLPPDSPGLWSCAFPQTFQLRWALQRKMYVTVTWDLVTALVPAAGLQAAWDRMASVLTLPAHKMCLFSCMKVVPVGRVAR